MAKPDSEDSCAGGRLGLVGLGVALLAVAGLAVCVMCLDARRRDQLTQLSDQLDMLRHQVDAMQKQLDKHEQKINSTVHAKSAGSKEHVEQEYEDDYEYDNEEDSYEYDDDDESNVKVTVKRTTVLGERTPSKTETEVTSPVTTTRSKRDVRSQQAVPVREERYVPSMHHLKHIYEPKNKAMGLTLYETYFDKDTKYVDYSEQVQQIKYRLTRPEHTEHEGQPVQQTKFSQPNERHHIHQIHASTYQEQRRPVETVVRLRHGGRIRSMDNEDVELIQQNSGEDIAHATGQQGHLLAAHFVGDASMYNSRDHSHYYGNNILYHPHGLFKDWIPSNWMLSNDASSDFPIYKGKLSIKKPGIYLVYAQIYYAASHDRCGFHIKHNEVEVAQCMTMTTGRVVKRNTCFTAAIIHLNYSDQLWISEVEGFRNTSFKSSHSFFGLIQLKPT